MSASEARPRGARRNGLARLLKTRWFELVQTIAIVGSLALGIWTMRQDEAGRQVQTLLDITRSHREIWNRVIDQPELARIADPNVNIQASPPTQQERQMLVLIILHLSAAYRATHTGQTLGLDGMEKDVKQFFNLPIPRAIWEDMRHYQDKDFSDWIDGHITNVNPIFSR